MRAMCGRHAGGVSVVVVPMAETIAVPVGLPVVMAVAGALAMAVKVGEALAEGLAVMCVDMWKSVRESDVVEGSAFRLAGLRSRDIRAAPWLRASVSRRRERG
jgi:hypothetical protein